MVTPLVPVAMKPIRIRSGKTKAQVAREAGMQAGLIGWIEEGRFIPYDSQLEKIARVLGIDEPETLMEPVKEDINA